MKPDDMLVPVWHMRWADATRLRQWSADGVPFMTAERLASLVQEAQRAGYEAGERQGRANLRAAIESGKVERPLPDNPA